jgi:hypothetical protein
MIRKNTRARHADKLLTQYGSEYTITPYCVVGSVYKVSLRFNGKALGHFYDEADAKEYEKQHRAEQRALPS